MKHLFQLTAVAIAISAITGSVSAAPTLNTDFQVDAKYGSYQRIIGSFDSIVSANNNIGYTSNSVNNVAVTQAANEAASATVVDINGRKYLSYALNNEQRANSTQSENSFINGSIIAASEQAILNSKDVFEYNNSSRTGTAIHGGAVLQELQTDAQGNPVKNAQGAYVTVGNKFRANDSQFGFTADDLTKVAGATRDVNKSSSTDIQYKSGQMLDRVNQSKSESVSERNAISYGTDGKQKQSNGSNDYIVTGYKNSNSIIDSTYQSGKSELGRSLESNSEGGSTNANYYYDVKGNFKFTSADGNGNNAYSISNVSTSENKSSNLNKTYQPNQIKQTESISKSSSKDTTTDIFDGFMASNESTSDSSNTQYANAKNRLNSESKSSRTSASKKRELERDSNYNLMLKDGKPIVKFVAEANDNSQNESATFEASEYQDGVKKGQDTVFFKQGFNGLSSTRFTDSSIEHSLNNSQSNQKRTDAIDGFVANNNSKIVNTANYARNLQENIEVARDLVYDSQSDVKDIQRGIISGKAANAQFAPTNLNFKIDGSPITPNDVRQWTEIDSNGKETKKYYVVVGTDSSNNEIRKEFSAASAALTEQKANLISQNVSSSNVAEKVYAAGDKVFYDKKVANSNNLTETVQGAAVGERISNTQNTKVTLFNQGEVLARQAVEQNTQDNQTAYNRDVNGLIILENGQPVIDLVAQQKNSITNTRNAYQAGQAKTDENISAFGYENKLSNASGKVLATETGKGDFTSVNYAKGQELDRTIDINSTNNFDSNSAQVVANDWTGGARVDINGSKVDLLGNAINSASVIAFDSNGKPVFAGGEDKVASLDVTVASSTTSNLAEKAYQTGAVAYSKVTADATNATAKYSDGFEGKANLTANSSVTLYNNGVSDKSRDFNSSVMTDSKLRTYSVDKDGKAVALKDTTRVSKDTQTEVNYQAGQVIDTQTIINSDVKVSTVNADKSTADYTNVMSADALVNQTEMGVLATNAIKSVIKSTDNENVINTDAKGATTTYGIAGSIEDTAYSNGNGLSKRTNVVINKKADGSSVTVSDAQNDELVNHGIYGDTTRTRTTANTTAAGVTSAVLETRVDGIASTTMSKKAADGKIAMTTVSADGITTTGTIKAANGVADDDITTVGQVRAGNASTLASANTNAAAGDAVTLASANATTATTATTLRTEMATGNASTLSSANSYTDGRVNQVSRKLDNVEKTAYRGVAIALAAQQAVPNIQPGQVAVFGGVGHYEGETAGSIGVVTSFTNRVSASGAFGFAGSSSFGGRVGVSYLFGGN